MSNTTPYRIRVPGHLMNVEATTAPSLVDPALNDDYKNRIVTLPDGSKYFVDAMGVAVKIFEIGATAGDFAQVVYTNANDPNAATIFSLTTPPVTNSPALAQGSANLYIADDGTGWTWSGTAYEPGALNGETPLIINPNSHENNIFNTCHARLYRIEHRQRSSRHRHHHTRSFCYIRSRIRKQRLFATASNHLRAGCDCQPSRGVGDL